MKNLTVNDLCLIGVFTAIICVLAQVSIPMPYGVPMTLQTFAIPLAGVVLGKKRGIIVTLIYILLGVIGLPVFAGLKGGLGVVMGPTGGFILSFPLMAFTAGIGAEKNNRLYLAVWLLAGAVLNYLCGMVMFSVIMSSGLYKAFVACVLPFIPTSVIKIALVAVSGGKVRNVLVKGRVFNGG